MTGLELFQTPGYATLIYNCDREGFKGSDEEADARFKIAVHIGDAYLKERVSDEPASMSLIRCVFLKALSLAHVNLNVVQRLVRENEEKKKAPSTRESTASITRESTERALTIAPTQASKPPTRASKAPSMDEINTSAIRALELSQGLIDLTGSSGTPHAHGGNGDDAGDSSAAGSASSSVSSDESDARSSSKEKSGKKKGKDKKKKKGKDRKRRRRKRDEDDEKKEHADDSSSDDDDSSSDDESSSSSSRRKKKRKRKKRKRKGKKRKRKKRGRREMESDDESDSSSEEPKRKRKKKPKKSKEQTEAEKREAERKKREAEQKIITRFAREPYVTDEGYFELLNVENVTKVGATFTPLDPPNFSGNPKLNLVYVGLRNRISKEMLACVNPNLRGGPVSLRGSSSPRENGMFGSVAGLMWELRKTLQFTPMGLSSAMFINTVHVFIAELCAPHWPQRTRVKNMYVFINLCFPRDVFVLYAFCLCILLAIESNAWATINGNRLLLHT